MHEIEIKFRVESLQHILHALSVLGCLFGPPLKHIDTVYAHHVKSLSDFLTKNEIYVRIREGSNRHVTLTVKKPIRRDVLVKQEVEMDIGDAKKAQVILNLLGYHKGITVHKTRRVATYGDISICIDEVENLGTFIELEIMGDVQDTSLRKKLLNLAELVGLGEQDEVFEGYDIFLMRKMKNAL